MGVDPFAPSLPWWRDNGMAFAGSSSWEGSVSSIADTAVDGVASFPGETSTTKLQVNLLMQADLMQQQIQSDGGLGASSSLMFRSEITSKQLLLEQQQSHSGDGLGLAMDDAAVAALMLGVPPPPPCFGFGGRISNGDLLQQEANGIGSMYPSLDTLLPSSKLQLLDDAEFNTGNLMSFARPEQQQFTPNTGNLQIGQKNFQEFSGLNHLNLSSLMSGPLPSFNATQNCTQPTQAYSGKNASAASFVNLSEMEVLPNGNGSSAGNGAVLPNGPNGNGSSSAGNGASKPRARARRGQATDPHSIAERVRREKISDRMKDLQELVPNSSINKINKASMLDEIIDYVKFLQLQVKVLSMSRLGAAEADAILPLLNEQKTESELAFEVEEEVTQLMDDSMTAAMQYLQSKGMCLMPLALASAISTQKGTSSAAVPGGDDGDGEDVKNAFGAVRPPLGRPKEMKSRI